MILWNVLEGGEAPTAHRLEHSLATSVGAPAWSSSIGETVNQADPPPNVPFIHSLSPHPTKNTLLVRRIIKELNVF